LHFFAGGGILKVQEAGDRLQQCESKSRWGLWRYVRSLRLRKLAGSLLIVLTLLITFLMPWSEIALPGDGFMLGGHDIELTILAFVLLAGIALLVASRSELPPLLSSLGFTQLCLAAAGPASIKSAFAWKEGFLPSLIPLRI